MSLAIWWGLVWIKVVADGAYGLQLDIDQMRRVLGESGRWLAEFPSNFVERARCGDVKGLLSRLGQWSWGISVLDRGRSRPTL
jgi:hypothetical protein